MIRGRKREKEMDKEDAMDYYKKGKELFLTYKHDLSPERVKEIESLFKKAIELNPILWAPYYYLGELFYSIGRYSDAKAEFKIALEKKPDSEPAKYYLSEINRIETGYSLPKNVEEAMEMVNNPILLNHALIEWFENSLRQIIQRVLGREYGEEWWWEGVQSSVRVKYGERVQESRLKEERELPQLYFVDFYDYAKIIEKNKKIFSSFMEKPKEWIERLNYLESIRNAVMHCRGQYLSEKTISKLKESCFELQKLFKRLSEEVI